MMTFDRTWHDGDVIALSYEQSLSVESGHHQGKYILRGPVLMALPADGDHWKKAFVSAAKEENTVRALLADVQEWKVKAGVPADVPVLPEPQGEAASFTLVPYARAAARIALFPGRKQA